MMEIKNTCCFHDGKPPWDGEVCRDCLEKSNEKIYHLGGGHSGIISGLLLSD